MLHVVVTGRRNIEIYLDYKQRAPFQEWFDRIKDRAVKGKILARLDRAQEGNLGECASVGGGVFEMKIHYGPGYRLYFGQEGDRLIILLLGGDKHTQHKDIQRAKGYWIDYKRR